MGREQCKMRQEKKEKFISFRALQVISILIISLRVLQLQEGESNRGEKKKFQKDYL